ncbi:MAG TPA: FAD-binding oxidoreductase [Gemmatimonadaceae bacterium]|nr:FAD-binding oxidoreductase [Gemmatimonadaceae bacterium]
MSTIPNSDESVRLAFARDASGLELLPESVARPESAEEVSEILRGASATRTPVTPAGGQSSTTAASITDRGTLLSLRALDRIVDIDVAGRTVRVQPGASVADVRRAAAEHGLLFAPDPTSEEEATIGGALACNASGARSLRYGTTRDHALALRVALANGEIVELRRARLEKNTVGYAMAQNPIDWFIGSEGTLGVIVEAEFALLPLPESVIGLAIPFEGEADALAFVASARESREIGARCLEYFDHGAVEIVRDAAGTADWNLGGIGSTLVYGEEAGSGDESVLERWVELAERHGARVADARVFESEAELREARRLRHAVPACMNERGSAFRADGGRKVSTDWAVPYRSLHHAIVAARAAAGRQKIAQPVIYGHAGNGHPHENFIARDTAELEAVERAVTETLTHVLAAGGTVAAEHGIGKLKRRWLPLQMSVLQIRAMRSLKRELDPLGILAPGNVFP